MAHTRVGRRIRASQARSRVRTRRSIAEAPVRKKASPFKSRRKLASPFRRK